MVGHVRAERDQDVSVPDVRADLAVMIDHVDVDLGELRLEMAVVLVPDLFRQGQHDEQIGHDAAESSVIIASASVAVPRPIGRARPYSPRMRSAFSWKIFSMTVVRVAELAPLLEDALVGHARIVAAEHDLVLQARAHVDLEVAGKVLRRPAGHLPVDVALVQRDRRRLVDPRPARDAP